MNIFNRNIFTINYVCHKPIPNNVAFTFMEKISENNSDSAFSQNISLWPWHTHTHTHTHTYIHTYIHIYIYIYMYIALSSRKTRFIPGIVVFLHWNCSPSDETIRTERIVDINSSWYYICSVFLEINDVVALYMNFSIFLSINSHPLSTYILK